MEPKNWTREYFLNNQEQCLEELNSLTLEERAGLRENLEQNDLNKLCLFVGFVQDSMENEFYCEKYEVKAADGTVRVASGKYCDKLLIEDGEEVENPSQNLGERQTLVVVSPSCRNQWTHDVEAGPEKSGKRKEMEKQELTRSFTVKAYDSVDRPLNSLVEVIGFLTLKPTPPDSSSDMEVDGIAEDKNLPPYLIHSVRVKDLAHGNPLLNEPFPTPDQYSHEEIRKDLVKLLTQFTLGDEVSAHYILLHLISQVHARVNGEVLGKFSLNLICKSIPNEILSDLIKKFVNVVELLMPHSLYVPMTIETLNKKRFVPKKNYDTNRLEAGILQVPQHTQVILDETKLESGKLEEAGCLAVGDLAELIRNQQIHYDFKFYKIPFNTNISIMIWSEGKSLLPNDFLVQIQADADSVKLINENIAAAVHFIKPKLNAIRMYLTECRLASFEINDTQTQMIESDFIKMREQNNLQVDHLHALLVISRLIGISKGQKSLDMDSWETAKRLEIERIARLDKKTNEA